jgi:hypothetical protein
MSFSEVEITSSKARLVMFSWVPDEVLVPLLQWVPRLLLKVVIH